MKTAKDLIDRFKETSSRRFTVQLYDTIESKTSNTLSLTEDELYDLLGNFTETDSKSDIPLFNTTTFTSNDRQLDNARLIDCMIFDLDGKQFSYSPEDLKTIFSDYQFIAYETYSSEPLFEKWRWRVVLPLAHPITPEQYTALFADLTHTLRLDADRITQQSNAVFYLPSCPIGDSQTRISIVNTGKYLSPQVTKSTQNQNLSINTKERVNQTLNTDIRLSKLSTVCGFNLPQLRKGNITLEELKSISCMPAVGLSLASLVGLDIHRSGLHKDSGRLKSKALCSVLPWHDKDTNPSTGLLIKSEGENAGRVLYRSFKDVDADNPVFDLHYVYACQQMGKRIPFERWTRSTSQLWLIRALADAGVFKLPEIRFVDLPAACSPGCRRLYESMKLLVRVRAALDIYQDESVIFSFQFAEAWSGMSRQTASKHFDTLIEQGIVEQEWVETPSLKCNGFVPRFVRETTATNVTYTPDSNQSLLEQIIAVIKHFQSDGEKLPVQFVASRFPEESRAQVLEQLPLLSNYIDIGKPPDRRSRQIRAYASQEFE